MFQDLIQETAGLFGGGTGQGPGSGLVFPAGDGTAGNHQEQGACPAHEDNDPAAATVSASRHPFLHQ